MAVTVSLALVPVSATTLTAPPAAQAQTAVPPLPPLGALGPTTRDARSAGTDGAQRWAPPLAGTAAGVDVVDGTAHLDAARDGASQPAALRGAQREGLLDLGDHRFGDPVNRFAVPVDADVPPGAAVEVDVRGKDADGQWTEWTPATAGQPAVLDEPTREVGVRLVLLGGPGGAAPVVRTLQVVADRVATAPRIVEPRANYRIFATREGLVGGTTANGHVIRPNDMFVALPTRRALSPNGRGDYSVRVCTDAGRCVTAPVWDVGPWNTTDDYWNGGPGRQTPKDLATGVPQAQAAYQNNYNGGHDSFGRKVANPAGIDLADGTFSGLGLKDNGWVTVQYLWTGRSAAVGQVVSPTGSVPVRPAPTLVGDVGAIGDGASVDLDCQVPGPPVTGSQGTSTLWYQVAPGQFAPAAYVAGAPPVAACPSAAPPAPVAPATLPALPSVPPLPSVPAVPSVPALPSLPPVPTPPAPGPALPLPTVSTTAPTAGPTQP